MLADGGCGNLGEPDRHDDSKAGFRFFFKIWGQHGVNKLLLPQCSDRTQTQLFHEARMGLSAAAVGPIETMVPGLPGQKVNGNIR